jgi:hypothetical protein
VKESAIRNILISGHLKMHLDVSKCFNLKSDIPDKVSYTIGLQ